jgi:hypothetical protein
MVAATHFREAISDASQEENGRGCAGLAEHENSSFAKKLVPTGLVWFVETLRVRIVPGLS